MFKLNLKIALRNIWKNRSASFINMAGLALGLAGFITILLYLNFETGFDKWSPKLKNVYKIGVHFEVKSSNEWWETLPGSLTNLIREQVPEAESVSIVNWAGGVLVHDRQYYYDINYRQADSTFFHTYPFTFIHGDERTALHEPNTAVINKKTALRLFGTDNVLGKTIQMGLDKKNFTIKGVWDDAQNRSHFEADVVTPIEVPKAAHWGNFSYQTYVRLKDGVDQEAALAKINRLFLDAKARWSAKNENKEVSKKGLLTEAEADAILNKNDGGTMNLIHEPVGKVHLSSAFSGKSRETTVYVLTGLAVFLLAIACINFTNLTIAHAGKRAREIGVKKVLGVERKALVFQFLFETFLQTFCAFLLGLALVELLLPYFNGLLGASLSFLGAGNASKLLIEVSVVFLLVTLCAGLYPAIYFSGFMPAKVLKGNYERSTKGMMIRRVLIVTQFVITCTFIICFAVMFTQLKYMRAKDIGLQRDQVLVIRTQTDQIKNLAADKFAQIRERLKNIPGVNDVSLSSRAPWSGGNSSGDASYLTNEIMLDDYAVDFDYFKTLNIPVIKGRGFDAGNFNADTANANVVINEMAAKEFGMKDPIGKVYNRMGRPWRVIGVVKDFNDQGFEKTVKPAHFIITHDWMQYNNLLVSISPDHTQQTVKDLEVAWKTIEPGLPIRKQWLDEAFNNRIVDYHRQGILMQVFSLATMGIALLGLFALAAYNARIRTREIAVRKVLGASIPGILKLLNREFVILVGIANLIAFVVAYILMSKWLNGFAYRIEVPYFLFLLTGLLSLTLTVLTVSWQAYKAALANPVAALKYE